MEPRPGPLPASARRVQDALAALGLASRVDTSLRRFDVVWAAGGTPHCVFPIAPADLLRASGATETAID